MMRSRAGSAIVWASLLPVLLEGCALGPGEPQTTEGRVASLSEVNAEKTPAVRPGLPKEKIVYTAYFEPSPGQPLAAGESQAKQTVASDLADAPLPPSVANPSPFSLGPLPDAASDARIAPLLLDDVVLSVRNHYPLLLAVLQEEGITTGQLLAAQGAFDLNLRGREFWQAGTYDSNRVILGLDQNLAWNGLSYFAGYRQSHGDFPIYYGDRKTGDGGEFRAGVLIPLLANRAIDRRRATLQQAALARQMADPIISAQRIDFLRAASRAYWTWAAAGLRLQIAQAVLKIAEDRDKQIAELVARGALAEIERTDNQRVIVERQARLIAAQRLWQQAAIALSLYYRDSSGEPQVPPFARTPERLPEPQPLDPQQAERDLQFALAHRPELERLRLQRQRTAVELELARNQRLPGLNLGLEGYQDVGYGSNFSKTPLVSGTELDRTAYVASLQLDVPLQRREARGRAVTAEHTLVQLGFQEQFQRQRIVAELQDAVSALERSFELVRKARENVALARRVEEGERERFAKGQGTIVILNLRELVAAEAAFAEIDALAEFHRAMADYQAAVGLDPDRLVEAPRQ
jgi:cobalt-zinc-cadmium efflux system outer membrane protein